MTLNKRGQIVKFHTPYECEDPDDLYLVLEYMEHGERSRVRVQALNTGYSFPWTRILYARDFVVDEIQSRELEFYLKNKNHGLV